MIETGCIQQTYLCLKIGLFLEDQQHIEDKEDKGLQKFADSKLAKRLPLFVEKLLQRIISSPALSVDQIFDLTDEEKKKIESVLTAGYITLADEDREQFIDKVDPIISRKSRNDIWERNHWAILNVISWQTIQRAQIPTIKDIGDETGLSRTTVSKHLKEYYDSETYREKENTYNFLREKLLAKIFAYAYEGNTKAAKIFLDATANSTAKLTVNNQQNNFIQINELVITQESIMKLSEEKLEKLREIII